MDGSRSREGRRELLRQSSAFVTRMGEKEREPGALGNGLKGLELAKVGLIAHPMQNFLRNMIGTLFLMSGGFMICK